VKRIPGAALAVGSNLRLFAAGYQPAAGWTSCPAEQHSRNQKNGARQMEEAGIHYRGHDNCFTWIEDFSPARSN
jgi:hypothetical protein